VDEERLKPMPNGPPTPTWGRFLTALTNIREQGFDLVQITTSCPGDGFEIVTATMRKPDERERA